MTAQISFYRKNHIDLNRTNITLSVEDSVATDDGSNSLIFLRNRNNITGWLTTNSDDTADTVLTAEFGDLLPVDFVELVRHNFKDYLVEWQDVSNTWNTYIDVTNSTDTTSIHTQDTPVSARGIRITIYATQVADADKELRQLIITEKIHTFNGWPVIKKPERTRERKVNKMPSGRVNIARTRGSFSCELEIEISSNETDLDIHENLYERNEGVLMLLSGGDEDQFKVLKRNYKNEDIVLVSPIDEYVNPFLKGVYSTGIRVRMKLAEVDR